MNRASIPHFRVRHHGAARPRHAAGIGLPLGRRALAAGLLLLGACSLPLPQAQSDPTRYYILSAPETLAAPPPAAAAAPIVQLRPIELSAYLRSQRMVVRRGANEVEFKEFSRWGEPLDQGIARVLKQELLARRAVRRVLTGLPRPSEADYVDYELAIRILSAEGDADGSVRFDASWQLRRPSGERAAVTAGEFRAAGLRWNPRREETLAGALSRAVFGLAADIASAMPGQPPKR